MFKLELLDYEEISTVNTPAGRHYRTPAGDFPSVTTVLSAEESPWLDEWKKRVGEEEAEKIKNEAANRGTRFHDLNERFLLNQEIDWKNMDQLTRSHFMQVKKWMEKNIEVVYGSEIPVYSTKLKCAGRTDAIVQINGKMVVLDFKTSKHFKEEIESYRMQCSAYIYCMNERFGLNIQNYCVLISNLYENFPSVFTGKGSDHIVQFANLRKRWHLLQNT